VDVIAHASGRIVVAEVKAGQGTAIDPSVWPLTTFEDQDLARQMNVLGGTISLTELSSGRVPVGTVVDRSDLATEATDAIDALPEGAALPPVHPGEILMEEFIRPHGLTPIRTANRLGVPRTRIERLVAGATAMTEDTALRLERLFGSSAEFWLRLQADYDLVVARRRQDPTITAIEPLQASGSR
jgi:addiction module HigA family antidote